MSDSEEEFEEPINRRSHRPVERSWVMFMGRIGAEFVDPDDLDPGCLQLTQVVVDQRCVDYLIDQWQHALQNHPMRERITAIFDAVDVWGCTFENDQDMDHFVNNYLAMTIGESLRQVCLSGREHQRPDARFHTRSTITSFLQGCQNIACLEHLVIWQADVCDQGQHLQSLLQNPLANIAKLEMDDCLVDDGLVDGLLAGLQSRGLNLLNLSGWKLRNSQFRRLVQTLIHSPNQSSLQQLDISDNNLTIKACPMLAELVTEMISLRELQMEHNTRLFRMGRRHRDEFGKKRALVCEFFDAIGANTTLDCLLMRNCGLSEQSAIPLLQALAKNSTLTTLSMSSKTDLASAFVESGCLPNLQRLATLFVNLDLNHKPLQQSLSRNTSITWLGVYPRGVRLDEVVFPILQRNRVLHVIYGWMEKHHGDINPTTWPLCVHELDEKWPHDATPIHAFLLATSLHVIELLDARAAKKAVKP